MVEAQVAGLMKMPVGFVNICILTDGGDNLHALVDGFSPCTEHYLDWFHVTMPLTVLGQYAKGLAHHDAAEAEEMQDRLERIKWKLWHGDAREALRRIEDLAEDLDALESDYPNLARFAKAAAEFAGYIVNQRRRHLFARRHARRSLVKGRERICPWLETLERSDQAAAAV
jgi:hypothetical protein